MTENQNELKLLPCPFCGNKPHPVYESHGYTWCENDNCVMWGVGEVFSDQWNTRATSPAERQIEAIRAAMDECKRAWPDKLQSFYTEIEKILEESK